MKIEPMSVERALEQGARLEFAMVRTMSSVSLGEASAQPDCAELLEARFFSKEKEIRLFRREDKLCAVCFSEEAGERYIEKTYCLREQNNKKFGEKLTVRYGLKTDEDGQTSIQDVRLCDWEGAASHG